jgi:hypothetical protein
MGRNSVHVAPVELQGDVIAPKGGPRDEVREDVTSGVGGDAKIGNQ